MQKERSTIKDPAGSSEMVFEQQGSDFAYIMPRVLAFKFMR